MGSSAASAECLRAILREKALQVVGVVTQPDRPAGRGKTLTPCPCAQFAEAHGITEIIKPENVNTEEPMAKIRAWRPDVIAAVAYGQILKKPLLELPLFGCVNCHF
jgi:methionyl-tRNA formyltransferase